MTILRNHRCRHCRDHYTYTLSGHERSEYNDHDYCPSCCKVVREALAVIPRCYEVVWEPTTEVTLETLRHQEQKNDQEPSTTGFPKFKRVSFPLYNQTEKGWVSDQSGYVCLNDRNYNYRFWPGKESEAVITVQMELNVRTGEKIPC